ncbi:transposase [bacterium]|nr:transposase [bacterium]
MRHPTHDYASGAGYFITFNTYRRKRLLGRIADGVFTPFPAGEIVFSTWNSLPEKFSCVILDAFQLMPDHVHCILILNDPRVLGKQGEIVPLPAILQALKGSSSRSINQQFGTVGSSVWQNGYRDRVIRNERELEKFRSYIMTNPQRWDLAGKG